MLLRMGFLCKLQCKTLELTSGASVIVPRAHAEHWLSCSSPPHRGPSNLELRGQQGEADRDALCSTFWMERTRNPYFLRLTCSDQVSLLSKSTLYKLSSQRSYFAVKLKGSHKLVPCRATCILIWNFPLCRAVSSYLTDKSSMTLYYLTEGNTLLQCLCAETCGPGLGADWVVVTRSSHLLNLLCQPLFILTEKRSWARNLIQLRH